MTPTGKKSLMHPDFRYTPSTQTDIRKTFARARREMAKLAAGAEPLPPVVVSISADVQPATDNVKAMREAIRAASAELRSRKGRG